MIDISVIRLQILFLTDWSKLSYKLFLVNIPFEKKEKMFI